MSAQAHRAFSPDTATHEVVVPGHEVGGTVADLHRMLAGRLAAMPAPEAIALPLDEKLVQLVSRVTGYALLAAGFAGAAWLIL